MNKEQVIEIAVAAALEWQKKQQHKQNKFRHDKRLRNTRLLLKHYPLLKEHCEKAVYTETDNANAIDILDDIDKYEGKTYIEAIKRSVARTKIIIQHIGRLYIYVISGDFGKMRMSLLIQQYGPDNRIKY